MPQAQVQPHAAKRPTRYALGRRSDAGTNWIGFIKGASNALQATLVAQAHLDDPEVSAAPWRHLPPALKRACRAGCVIEVRG